VDKAMQIQDLLSQVTFLEKELSMLDKDEDITELSMSGRLQDVKNEIRRLAAPYKVLISPILRLRYWPFIQRCIYEINTAAKVTVLTNMEVAPSKLAVQIEQEEKLPNGIIYVRDDAKRSTTEGHVCDKVVSAIVFLPEGEEGPYIQYKNILSLFCLCVGQQSLSGIDNQFLMAIYRSEK
jgi:hypothetical protein